MEEATYLRFWETYKYYLCKNTRPLFLRCFQAFIKKMQFFLDLVLVFSCLKLEMLILVPNELLIVLPPMFDYKKWIDRLVWFLGSIIKRGKIVFMGKFNWKLLRPREKFSYTLWKAFFMMKPLTQQKNCINKTCSYSPDIGRHKFSSISMENWGSYEYLNVGDNFGSPHCTVYLISDFLCFTKFLIKICPHIKHIP